MSNAKTSKVKNSKAKAKHSAATKLPPRFFRVGRSRTGLGLFATTPIVRGTVIVEYTGPRIATPEATRRERKHGHRYMMTIDKHWTIDGSPRTNMARYVNHACKPNAEAVNDRGRVFLLARRRILPDEEITSDYGREYVALFFGNGQGCLCATCRPSFDPQENRAPGRDGAEKPLTARKGVRS